jgi:flagellar basal body-associated protein FliL
VTPRPKPLNAPYGAFMTVTSVAVWRNEMENRSDHGGALVAICLILILLLLIGGAGMGIVYVGRKQAALAMQARMAEAEAQVARQHGDGPRP